MLKAEAVTERDMREIRHRLLASQLARLRSSHPHHTRRRRGGGAASRRRRWATNLRYILWPIRGLEIDIGSGNLAEGRGEGFKV